MDSQQFFIVFVLHFFYFAKILLFPRFFDQKSRTPHDWTMCQADYGLHHYFGIYYTIPYIIYVLTKKCIHCFGNIFRNWKKMILIFQNFNRRMFLRTTQNYLLIIFHVSFIFFIIRKNLFKVYITLHLPLCNLILLFQQCWLFGSCFDRFKNYILFVVGMWDRNLSYFGINLATASNNFLEKNTTV